MRDCATEGHEDPDHSGQCIHCGLPEEEWSPENDGVLVPRVDTSMTVRVVKVSRNTGWGHDPQLSYRLRPGERVLSASHRYGDGNFEGLTLIVLGLTRDLPEEYKYK